MTADSRTHLSLRLVDGDTNAGEIRLDELAKIATQTQVLVRRLARGLINRRKAGRTSRVVEDATALTLVGIRPGSTILDIAAPSARGDLLEAEGMPTDLGERTLDLLFDAMDAVVTGESEMPLNVDSAAGQDLDVWLKGLRRYGQVELASTNRINAVVIKPKETRERLREVAPAPSVPFVSAHQQALSGRLYALNLNTGSFSIEDDSGRKIRLTVAPDLRDAAATLANRRVRAVGHPIVDDRQHLTGFEVVDLNAQPEIEGLQQGAFFERHDLGLAVRAEDRFDDGDWAISDLTEQEADAFLDSVAELR